MFLGLSVSQSLIEINANNNHIVTKNLYGYDDVNNGDDNDDDDNDDNDDNDDKDDNDYNDEKDDL